MIALSFFVLAVYVVIESVRAFAGAHPEASWVGIGLAAVTAPTMPLLARAKRRVGHQLGSRATVSEGSQNMLCAYLSVALLVGLGANALFGVPAFLRLRSQFRTVATTRFETRGRART
jgi:divalent metal cation (Fe/Co/Zn/Cd) transporter